MRDLGEGLWASDAAGVRTFTLDRPESRNGLTLPLVERLTGAVREAAEDDRVRVVVFAGAGAAFSSGLDLKSALSVLGEIEPAAGLKTFQDLARAVRHLTKPTLAALDGPAAGFGADLALGCDLRVASTRARLGERFVGVGLMPDGGGTFYLPRLVGLTRAFELMYRGRMVEADEGLALGLWTEVLPVEGFSEAVQARAAALAEGPPLSFARIKRAVLAATEAEFEACLNAEGEGQLALMQSADFAEGVQAFLAKRPPKFEGR